MGRWPASMGRTARAFQRSDGGSLKQVVSRQEQVVSLPRLDHQPLQRRAPRRRAHELAVRAGARQVCLGGRRCVVPAATASLGPPPIPLRCCRRRCRRRRRRLCPLWPTLPPLLLRHRRLHSPPLQCTRHHIQTVIQIVLSCRFAWRQAFDRHERPRRPWPWPPPRRRRLRLRLQRARGRAAHQAQCRCTTGGGPHRGAVRGPRRVAPVGGKRRVRVRRAAPRLGGVALPQAARRAARQHVPPLRWRTERPRCLRRRPRPEADGGHRQARTCRGQLVAARRQVPLDGAAHLQPAVLEWRRGGRRSHQRGRVGAITLPIARQLTLPIARQLQRVARPRSAACRQPQRRRRHTRRGVSERHTVYAVCFRAFFLKPPDVANRQHAEVYPLKLTNGGKTLE